jgi:hypothetical protein
MKQQIPPAAIVAVIVVILVLVGFIGYKTLAPEPSRAPTAPTGMTAEQKAQYEDNMKNSNQNPGRSSNNSIGYPGSNSGH